MGSSMPSFLRHGQASSTDRLSLTCVPLFAPGHSLLNFQPGVDGGGAGLRAQASDDDLQVRPLIGPLEIGDVRLDFLRVQDPLLPGEVLVDGSRVDVVEGDPLQMFSGVSATATATPGTRRTTRRKASRRPLGGSAITQSGWAAAIRSSTTAQSFR